jgi:hypothetical protein
MTRTGKIALLPNPIREQLNRRLHDGERGKSILAWLNSLPEVQAVLAASFGGRPVLPSNLTEWKQGGYLDWQVRQDALAMVANLKDEQALGDQTLTDQLNTKLARWVAIQYAAAAQALIAAEPDPKLKWPRLRQLCADVARLRRGDHHAERLGISRERLALEQANTDHQREQQFWEWTKRPDIAEKLSPKQKRGLSEEAMQLFDNYLLEGISPMDPEQAMNAKSWGRFAAKPPIGYQPQATTAPAEPAVGTHSTASQTDNPPPATEPATSIRKSSPGWCPKCRAPLPPPLPTGERPSTHCSACGAALHEPEPF